MAKYTAEVVCSERGYVYKGNPSYHPEGTVNTVDIYYDPTNATSQSFGYIKFGNRTAIEQFRRKKVTNAYLKLFCSVRKPGTSITGSAAGKFYGGTISLIESAFSTTSITYNSRPASRILYYEFNDFKTGTLTARRWVSMKMPYYMRGDLDYRGNPTPRSFYDQMEIGFALGLPLPVTDENQKKIQYTMAKEDSTPVIVFEFEDFTQALKPLFPSSGAYINPRQVNIFAAGFEFFQSIDYPTAREARIEFKDKETGAIFITPVAISVNLQGRTDLQISLPANTLTGNKVYQWHVKIITDDGETDWGDWADFTTRTAVPDPPSIIQPQAEYLDAEKPFTFIWRHNISTGTPQYAYDLDYKQGNNWTEFVRHAVTSAQEVTLSAYTLYAGQLMWRVRTYNEDNVPGEYTLSSISVVQARPKVPVIQSISDTPRPIITWQSTGQQAYSLVIQKKNGEIVEKTGNTFGTMKSYQTKDFLSDGVYDAILKIQNLQGQWSDPVVRQFAVTNRPPSWEDILKAVPVEGAVAFEITSPDPVGGVYAGEMFTGGFYAVHEPLMAANGQKYLMRDNVAIKKFDGNNCVDLTSAGEHTYYCRIIGNNGIYFDTKRVIASPILRNAILSGLLVEEKQINLQYCAGGKPEKSGSISKETVEHYFYGRTLPVFDVLDRQSASWTFKYSFLDRNSFRAMEGLFVSSESVILRDPDGFSLIGVLRSLSQRVEGGITTVTFSINECDYIEKVEYE